MLGKGEWNTEQGKVPCWRCSGCLALLLTCCCHGSRSWAFERKSYECHRLNRGQRG